MPSLLSYLARAAPRVLAQGQQGRLQGELLRRRAEEQQAERDALLQRETIRQSISNFNRVQGQQFQLNKEVRDRNYTEQQGIAERERVAALTKADRERKRDALTATGLYNPAEAEARIDTGVDPVQIRRQSEADKRAEDAAARSERMTDVAERRANAAIAKSQQPPGAGKTTADERKASALFDVAKDAYDTVERLAPNLAAQQAKRIPIIGNILSGKLDEQTQVLNQAAYQLADSWMRFVSGAAVPETEVRRYMETFTPQVGDQPAVTERKRAARKTLIDALEHAAGRARTGGGTGTTGRRSIADVLAGVK